MEIYHNLYHLNEPDTDALAIRKMKLIGIEKY